MILAIDPDTTAMGWAIGDVRGPHECGEVRPNRTRDEPWERSANMALQLFAIKGGVAVDHIVIEMPSAHAPQNGKGRAGQATYGIAPGAVYTAFLLNGRECAGVQSVHGVRANIWTRGRNKQDRAAEIFAAYPDVYGPHYIADCRRGLHIADAVGLLVWFCEEQAVRGAI